MSYNLNLFKEPYPYNWKHLRGFFKNIRVFFRIPRRIYERATKGYCYMDVVEMRSHLTYLISSMLCALGNGCSYPPEYIDKGGPEEWARDLKRIAALLEASDRDEIDIVNLTSEEAMQKYEECKQNLHKALTMLEEIWYDLWD